MKRTPPCNASCMQSGASWCACRECIGENHGIEHPNGAPMILGIDLGRNNNRSKSNERRAGKAPSGSVCQPG